MTAHILTTHILPLLDDKGELDLVGLQALSEHCTHHLATLCMTGALSRFATYSKQTFSWKFKQTVSRKLVSSHA